VLKKIFLKLKIPIEKTTWSNIKKKKFDAFLTVLLALQTEYRADFIETILVWEQQLQTYRASRHFKGYPSNGQRTITNGCTAMKMRKVIAQLQKLA
jgi:ribosomal protein S13